MSKSQSVNQWSDYIETPIARGTSCPVKLDKILAQRMQAFMEARQAHVNK